LNLGLFTVVSSLVVVTAAAVSTGFVVVPVLLLEGCSVLFFLLGDPEVDGFRLKDFEDDVLVVFVIVSSLVVVVVAAGVSSCMVVVVATTVTVLSFLAFPDLFFLLGDFEVDNLRLDVLVSTLGFTVVEMLVVVLSAGFVVIVVVVIGIIPALFDSALSSCMFSIAAFSAIS